MAGTMTNAVERLARLLPQRRDYADARRSWRADVVAGVSVAIVALPLALGFGISSGMGAAAGLVTAVVAGFVAGVFGGSHVQVTGPTGAMAVVLAPIVARSGPSAVLMVAIVAGAIIVVAALAGVGRYLAYLPWPVIEGFTVGIAVIILLQQVPGALGVPKPKGTSTVVVAVKALARFGRSGSTAALLVTGVVVLIMVVGPRLHRALPVSLVAVAVATLGASALGLDVARIGTLPRSLPTPRLPGLAGQTASGLLTAALAVAALAAIESLLSARVADGMADMPPHDPDRELFGQGLANLVSPLFGGMPATGAIARTAVNVRAGARTRLAALIHAAALLGVVLVAAPLVSRIPLAALSGVLIVTAVRMVERHNVRAVIRATNADAFVLGITAVATVAFDLIVAVEIGVAVAALLALRSVARTATATRVPVPVEVDADQEHHLLEERIVTYRLDGALFFGAAQRFLTELTNVAGVDVVILRLPDIQVLDATGARALGEIVQQLEDRGVTVLLKGARPHHGRTLQAVGALERLASQRHNFDRLPDAIEHARSHVAQTRAHAHAR